MAEKHKIRAIQLRAYKPIGDRELPEWAKCSNAVSTAAGTVDILLRERGVTLRATEGDWLIETANGCGVISEAVFEEFYEAME